MTGQKLCRVQYSICFQLHPLSLCRSSCTCKTLMKNPFVVVLVYLYSSCSTEIVISRGNLRSFVSTAWLWHFKSMSRILLCIRMNLNLFRKVFQHLKNTVVFNCKHSFVNHIWKFISSNHPSDHFLSVTPPYWQFETSSSVSIFTPEENDCCILWAICSHFSEA